MVRFRPLAALLVTAVLAALPVLRSACDFECADPPAAPLSARLGIGAAASDDPSSDSHCSQHPESGSPAKPVRNGDDGCGHDHQAQRLVAARVLKLDPGVTSTLAPPIAIITAADVLSVPLTRTSFPPPFVRVSAAFAPLRI